LLFDLERSVPLAETIPHDQEGLHPVVVLVVEPIALVVDGRRSREAERCVVVDVEAVRSSFDRISESCEQARNGLPIEGFHRIGGLRRGGEGVPQSERNDLPFGNHDDRVVVRVAEAGEAAVRRVPLVVGDARLREQMLGRFELGETPLADLEPPLPVG
jgi:hypothetical protein